jgi:DNA-binding response OmpR family regulator
MNTTASILVIDDEPDLLASITLALEAEAYQALTAGNGLEALEILQKQPVNLILADIAMPDMNGYQLYERVRARPEWVTIPFVFLTARAMDSDIRYGKELGVDDYLTKPIRAADLLAVVRGKLRRAQQLAGVNGQRQTTTATEERFLTMARLRLDATQHRVWVDDQELKLSAKEFVLLEYLAQQAGGVVSPPELVQVTHSLTTDPVEAGALLRPLILSLRRKLGLPDGEIGSIENVRGVGYRLVVPG